MRKSLLMLAVCAAAVCIAAATATAATKTAKVTPYRAAALACDHRHSLEAPLTGSSIGFLRSTFVPCVLKKLRGAKITTSTALTNATAHDGRVFFISRAKDASTVANDAFDASAGKLCTSTTGNWAWTLSDNTPPPTLTYVVLAKQIDQAFFTTKPALGTDAKAEFAFTYLHGVFFHDGKPKNPVGIAGFVLVCP